MKKICRLIQTGKYEEAYERICIIIDSFTLDFLARELKSVDNKD